MTVMAPVEPVTASLVAGWVYTFSLRGGTRITGRYGYTDRGVVVVIDTRDHIQKRLATVEAVELVSVRSQAAELAAEPWE